MDLKVAKVLPGGNSTIIVESDVEPELRAKVSNILMGSDYLCAEQVGFLRPPTDLQKADARLEMMGGELCINALRSTAALLYSKDKSKTNVRLESSGFSGIIQCTNKNENDRIETAIQISCPLNFKEKPYGTLVQMEGIAHLVRKVKILPEKKNAEEEFRSILKKDSDLSALPACGFMPCIEDGKNIMFMPLVYVRDTASMIFETGCGSGSIAVALARYYSNSENSVVSILQPSGQKYSVEIVGEGEKTVLARLSSPVSMIFTGIVSIPSSL